MKWIGNFDVSLADITSIVAGTGLNGDDLTGPIPTLNVDPSLGHVTTLAGITAMGTAANTLVVTNDIVKFDSTNANDPLIVLKNAANDATSGRFRFLNARGADGQDDDETGIIEFFSYDDGTPNGERYARIIGTIHDATATEESGKLSLQVASHDGGDEDGLVLTGGSVDAEVDVTIGNGAASVVTIPGSITIGSTGAIIGAGIPNVYGSIIKLLPSDFAANIDGGNTKLGVGYTDTAGSAYGMKVGSANTELFAFVSIPEGMKATHVDVFDKDDRALEVFEVQINATSLTSKGSGNCNTTLDITDVNATATNFLAIKITTTATTDKVFGGQVTIAVQ